MTRDKSKLCLHNTLTETQKNQFSTILMAIFPGFLRVLNNKYSMHSFKKKEKKEKLKCPKMSLCRSVSQIISHTWNKNVMIWHPRYSSRKGNCPSYVEPLSRESSVKGWDGLSSRILCESLCSVPGKRRKKWKEGGRREETNKLSFITALFNLVLYSMSRD